MTSTPVGGGCYRRANAQLTTTASHTRAASRPGTPRAARPAASKNGLVLIGLSARFVIVRGPALSPRPPRPSIRSSLQEAFLSATVIIHHGTFTSRSIDVAAASTEIADWHREEPSEGPTTEGAVSRRIEDIRWAEQAPQAADSTARGDMPTIPARA